MTFGSLFSGIGGMDLGLERAGMRCVWQSEIDPYACRVLVKHWPGVPNLGDISRIDWSGVERPDLVCGGDPCQENSRARQGYDATRPSLGDEFIRAVDAIRPRLVLRENPTATRADAPWPWHRFRSELERLGYAVLPFRLRACCLGADHQRDRLFLLAERADAMPPGLQGHVIPAMEGADAKGSPETGRQAVCQSSRRDRWVSAPRVCRATDGVPNRVARLRALGNAVVPQVAEFIGRRLMEAAS